MKAVILAAGKGTRLYPLTINTPKILFPLFGKPLIEWFLEILDGLVEEVVFVVGDNDYSKQIETYINEQRNAQNAAPKISFVYQTEQLGTGHALQAAKESFNGKEKFILLYGDDLYAREDLENLVKHEYAVVGKKVNDPEKWGILQADENGNLKKIIEKPANFVGDIANIGMYLLDTDVFDIYDKTAISERGEFEVTDGISLFAESKPMKVLAVEKYWLPLGYPWMFLDAQEKLIKEHGYKYSGNSVIAKDAVVEDGAIVENSIINEGCVIKAGAEVRSSILGKRCCIEEGAKLHDQNPQGGTVKTMVKGKEVDTQREKYGVTLGDDVTIGANASIAAGVKIWPEINVEAGKSVDKDLED